MSERSLFLDVGPGETRGVVMLNGRPERLLIVRDGDVAVQALGARVAARVRAVDRASGLAFLDLGEPPDAVINLAAAAASAAAAPLSEGLAVEVEIRAEARRGKGAMTTLIGPAEGPPRLLSPGPSIETRLAGFAPGAPIETGPRAREMADEAQSLALARLFSLPGGGSVAIETTRALTAVDVDLGGRPGSQAKRAARAANLAAIDLAARILRLKGLGGLVVIDLVGRGHDAPALLAAARAAFGPDNPGVAFGAVSRFGTLELTIARRARPALDSLADETGRPTAATQACALARALEREALADPGARLVGYASPEVAKAAAPALAGLNRRLGGRLSLKSDPARAREDHEAARA